MPAQACGAARGQSGIVDNLDKRVKRYKDIKEGDGVYGYVGGCGSFKGALAAYVIADVFSIAHAPKLISLEESGALRLVTIAAYSELSKLGRNQIGHLLVHSGTGGVGHIAIQWAKLAHDTHVAATVNSDEKAELAKQLGADERIN